MSDKTLRTAVSVEWLLCMLTEGLEKALFVRQATSCLETSLSRCLETTDKLDIGLYDFVSRGSRSDFFSASDSIFY